MDEYWSYDAVGLAELVHRGEVTPRELVEAALERARDTAGKIHAIVHLDEQGALEEADRLNQAQGGRKSARSENDRPSLHGVPFLLKDLYTAAKGHPVTQGSRLFRAHTYDHDSVLVERYRQAGLVIFGRTATPELGLTTSTESTLFGQTRNPWSLEHTSGGSSGGASAVVSAGVVPAAHASDGGGSIRIPASCCGLFGLKPTRARVSMAPDKGEGWAGLSCNHAVTRSVRDSAVLLDAVDGPAVGDPYCAPTKVRPYREEVGVPPGQLRIAMTTESFNGAEVAPECRRSVEKAAELCASLGHQIVQQRPQISGEELSRAAGLVVSANVRATVEDGARDLGRKLKEADVEPLTWAMVHNTENASVADYVRAVSTLHQVGAQLAQFFEGIDLLLTPTMATLPPQIGELALDREDRSAYMECLGRTIGFTQLMNVAGNPAMSVPLGWSSSPVELPVGVQFAAPFGGEANLFRLAGQLEEAQPWFHRRPSC